MTPTGALSSFPYTPEASMLALKHFIEISATGSGALTAARADAFNLDQKSFAPIFMGLNQAPIVVMTEDYRTGLIWKLFMSDPKIPHLAKIAYQTRCHRLSCRASACTDAEVATPHLPFGGPTSNSIDLPL